MPKYKRKYKKRRPSKKSYRKKRKNVPLAFGSRYFKHKMTGVIPVFSTDQVAGEQKIDFIFSRYDYAGIVANVYGINSPPRWAQVRKNYE